MEKLLVLGVKSNGLTQLIACLFGGEISNLGVGGEIFPPKGLEKKKH